MTIEDPQKLTERVRTQLLEALEPMEPDERTALFQMRVAPSAQGISLDLSGSPAFLARASEALDLGVVVEHLMEEAMKREQRHHGA